MEIIIQDINSLKPKRLNKLKLQYNLFYLQKRIYQASKECHSSLVHSLQKLLLSLSSIRLLASKIVSTKYTTTKSLNIYTTNIKKLLTLWCLEAEWIYKIRVQNKPKYKYTYIWSYIWYQEKVSNIHIDYRYLNHKLQSIQWITTTIRLFFQEEYFIQESEYQYNYQIFCDKHQDIIFNLICNILIVGIEWTYFRQEIKNFSNYLEFCNALISNIFLSINCRTIYLTSLLINKFLYNIGILYLSIDPSSIPNYTNNQKKRLYICQVSDDYYKLIYYQMFEYTKSLFLHKDRIGRLRVNSHINFAITQKRCYQKLNQCFLYCISIISYKKFLKIQYQINDMIKKWIYKNIES
uniref:Reverse transcriptase N-terminal domain-containing protein n=1 Tax=Galaxaura rugosa TaxID=268570 RepID=A0A1G4NSU4_9FLOR|nr:Hypothetical protein ORF_3 [Galaxaura rugosa]SCW21738.1 Hypothetical protein ORF_3 [Galaxaura rugosa]